MARKRGKSFKSGGQKLQPKADVSLLRQYGTHLRNWVISSVTEGSTWLKNIWSSQAKQFLECRVRALLGPPLTAVIVDRIEDKRTVLHKIPLYVLSDILLPYLAIKDIGNVQKCCKSLNSLVEHACGLTAEMYINRSRHESTPLLIGSFASRVPYALPQSHSQDCNMLHCINLSVVCSLVHFGSLISRQREDVRYDYLATLQSDRTLGQLQFLDQHMRASVVDWMVEVSVEFSFAPSVLHCAVQLMDIMLSALPISRTRFQLLGCVSLLLRSRHSEGRGPVDVPTMTELDVVYMCDSQYSVEEVEGMVSIIERHMRDTSAPSSVGLGSSSVAVSTTARTYDDLIAHPEETLDHLNTSPTPTTLSFLAPLCAVMHLPLVMYQQLEIDMPHFLHYPHGDNRPAPSPSEAEHVLLAIFLADLSLLDYCMLRYSPFTISSAIICLTRLTLHHYATGQLLLTPYGVADGKSREVKQLIRTTSRRLYIAGDVNYLECPFGCDWLKTFILTCESERCAVRECMKRLWQIHSDYFGHLFHRVEQGDYTPQVLQYHTHMFSGIRDKFAARGSNREAVWQKLRVIPRDHLDRLLGSIFSCESSESGVE